MRKKWIRFSVIAAIILLLVVNVCAADSPQHGRCALIGGERVLSYDSISDGMYVQIDTDIVIDNAVFDRFLSCNVALTYDKSIIDIPYRDSVAGATVSDDYRTDITEKDYGCNIIITSKNVLESDIAAYTPGQSTSSTNKVTLSVVFRVVNANLLKAYNGVEIGVSLFHDDFNVAVDGERVEYQAVLEGHQQVEMYVTCSPMRITIQKKLYYLIHYDSRGGTTVIDDIVLVGGYVKLPMVTYGNRTFNGWYYDEDCTQKVDMIFYPHEDCTLYAGWSDYQPDTVTICFDTMGGSELQPMTVEKGLYFHLPTPTKANMVFDGWYTSQEYTVQVNEYYKAESDITLYAKWKLIADDVSVTVSFDTNGGSYVAPMTVQKGTIISLPTPTKKDCSFLGWYVDYNFSQRAAERYTADATILLVAKWQDNSSPSGGETIYIPVYRTMWAIIFDTMGGKPINTMEVIRGRTATLPTTTRDGYEFNGWYTEQECVHQVEMQYKPNNHVVLYAGWKKESVDTEPIDTDPIDTDPIDTDPIDTDPIDTDPIDTKPIDTDPIDTKPIDTEPIDTKPIDTDPIDTKPIDTEPIDTKPIDTDPIDTKPIDTDPIITTEETKYFVVKLYKNNGENSETLMVECGKSVILPTPKYLGHTFVGWCEDKALTIKIRDNNYTPTKDISLYALWTLNEVIPSTGGVNPAIVLTAVCVGLAAVIVTVIIVRKKKH